MVPLLGSCVSVWLRKPTFKVSQFRAWEYFDMLSKEFGDLFACCVGTIDAGNMIIHL